MGSRFIVLVFGLVLLLSVSSTTLANNDPIVVQVFVHEGGSYLDNTRIFFDAFERANPDIKVEIVSGPLGSSPEEKLSLMVASGVAPDLARLWNTKQAARVGLIQDLTPYFDRLPAEDRDDMWPPIVESLSFDGRLYALPLGTAVGTLFYNPRMFGEKGIGIPDESWAWEDQGIHELKKLAVDLDGDGAPNLYPMSHIGGQTYHVYSFIHSAGGGPLYSADGRQFLGHTPTTIEALEFLQEMVQIHHLMPPTAGGATNQFLSQNTAVLMWGSFMLGYFDHVPDLPWDIAPLPTFRGNRATSLWPETPYAIPMGAKHPEEAWRILEFMYSPEGQTLAMELGWGIPPARISVAQTAFVRSFDHANINALIQLMQSPLNQPMPHQAPSQATSLLSRAFQDAIAGIKSASQAIGEVSPVIQSILASVE